MTAYRRLAESRHSRRFHVVAGRPVSAPAGNPWADAANRERQRAAAFADRVVACVCIAIAIVVAFEYVSPDVAAWLEGRPAVVVAR